MGLTEKLMNFLSGLTSTGTVESAPKRVPVREHVMRLSVAGVTYRQETVRAVVERKKPFNGKINITFSKTDDSSDMENGVEVLINGQLVGYIPKNRLKEFISRRQDVFRIKYFKADSFKDENKNTIYYIKFDIVFPVYE